MPTDIITIDEYSGREDREDVVVMIRARNEERWLAMLLGRAFEVAREVVIFEDDFGETEQDRVCLEYMGTPGIRRTPYWHVTRRLASAGGRLDTLSYIKSPFRPGSRMDVSPNEPRDREFLWQYVKSNSTAKYVLALDGDEVLSRKAVRTFPKILDMFRRDLADLVIFPFIYLWDREDQRRVDGWFRNLGDGEPNARFPRLFSLEHLTLQQLKATRFPMRANFLHCGSIPTEFYAPHNEVPRAAFARAPIIHYGYFDEELRQTKYLRYNAIDPDNEAEGQYLHILGGKNKHCPGDVEFSPYLDE